jgi:rod shape determining protein RodA
MQQLRRIDLLLVSCILIACFAGIFTLYSQEAILGEDSPGRWYRQLIFFIIGLIIMFGMRRLNYQALGAVALPLYVFGLILLLITMVVATEIKGARSWIRIGSFGFQTSEVAKLATIILVAKYLELKERDIERLQSLFPPSLIVGAPMLLILIQPDFGGAFSLAPILLAMLFLAGADIYHIGSVVLFISVSISIPLYIEYHKITLVQPLMERLSVLGSENLLPAVRILRTDIWDFADTSRLPETLAATDRDYLTRLAGNRAEYCSYCSKTFRSSYPSAAYAPLLRSCSL